MASIKVRKNTLREALGHHAVKKNVFVGKLGGRYLFRAAVRKVIEYMEWISESTMGEEIGENVIMNVKLAQRKKLSDDELTPEDRGVLFIPPHKRTKDDKAYIEQLLTSLNTFKRYPSDVRDSLVDEILLQYVTPGRTIIKQNHKPNLMYYVVRGHLQIIKDITDKISGETTTTEIGSLEQGDIFGEIAMMHNVPRTATVVSKTPCDLLIVTRNTFNEHLRSVLMEEWDILHDALVNFNYFKGWSEKVMRECCILSKIVDYKPKEILLGDGRGMIHYVYFILQGECRLIEHLLVEKKKVKNKVKYQLYDANQMDISPRRTMSRPRNFKLFDEDESSIFFNDPQNMTNLLGRDETNATDYIKMLSAKKAKAKVALERLSVITVTLQDVINEWHEISDAVEMLMKQPSVNSLVSYPSNVETIFMQICLYYRGACFGLGEQMRNRRIVSITPTKCLLIPRFWLLRFNRANIWERVKFFLNSKLPTQKQLLDSCIENRKWEKYKKDYADHIIRNGRRIPNDTKYYDVPYSIRINENIIDE